MKTIARPAYQITRYFMALLAAVLLFPPIGSRIAAAVMGMADLVFNFMGLEGIHSPHFLSFRLTTKKATWLNDAK